MRTLLRISSTAYISLFVASVAWTKKWTKVGEFDILLDANLSRTFNTRYIDKLESDWSTKFTSGRKISTLSKLGKLALYVRLYRRWIRNPHTGRLMDPRGIDRVNFNTELFDDCSNAGGEDTVTLENCLHMAFRHLANRTSYLFPGQGQRNMGDYLIEERSFTRYTNRWRFSYDISLATMLCFWTRSRLSLMKQLPFCRYGTEESDIHIWLSDDLRDMLSRDDVHPDVIAERHFREPVDTLITHDRDFQCAEESFCPDPCCGLYARRINKARLLHTFPSNLPKCPNSPCAESVDGQRHHCLVIEDFNHDFVGIHKSRWNLTCTCERPGMVYNFDLGRCVHIDECRFVNCEGANEECLNTLGSYECVCKVGFFRDIATQKCQSRSLP